MKNKKTVDSQNEKSLKIRLINIVLYPEESQRPERYVDLFRKIQLEKIQVNTYSDKFSRIRTMYESNGLLYGKIINYTRLKDEGWFNDRKRPIFRLVLNS